MLYFKVLEIMDGKKYNNKNDCVIADELYTYKEMEKYKIPFQWCNSVEVKKNKTYKFFGARFCDDESILKIYC